VPSAGGPYYMIAFYNAAGVHWAESFRHVGDPYCVYDNVCSLSTGWTGITVGGATNTDFNFGDSCTWIGTYGNANYTGSKGTVGSNTICVLLYSDSSYTTPVYFNGIHQNNSRYDAVPDVSGTYYMRLYYDADGSSNYGSLGTCLPTTGDPYINVGAVTSGVGNPVNVSFDDSTLWP
jgi:hypothetical protein